MKGNRSENFYLKLLVVAVSILALTALAADPQTSTQTPPQNVVVRYILHMYNFVIQPFSRIISILGPSIIIGFFFLAIIRGTLTARSDIMFAAGIRSFILSALLVLSPSISYDLTNLWGKAYAWGSKLIGLELRDLVDEHESVVKLVGGMVVFGSLGVALAKGAVRAAVVTGAEKYGVKESEEIVVRNFLSDWIDNNGPIELANGKKLTNAARASRTQIEEALSNKDIGKNFNEYTRKLKTQTVSSAEVPKTPGPSPDMYLSILGMVMVPLIWVFILIGLTSATILTLALVAFPIGILMLAISPQNGVGYMRRSSSYILGSTIIVLLVPWMVAGLADYFIGQPLQNIQVAIDHYHEVAIDTSKDGVFDAIRKIPLQISAGARVLVVAVAQVAVALIGVLAMALLSGFSAGYVPSMVGGAFFSSGLAEGIMLGRGAVPLAQMALKTKTGQKIYRTGATIASAPVRAAGFAGDMAKQIAARATAGKRFQTLKNRTLAEAYADNRQEVRKYVGKVLDSEVKPKSNNPIIKAGAWVGNTAKAGVRQLINEPKLYPYRVQKIRDQEEFLEKYRSLSQKFISTDPNKKDPADLFRPDPPGPDDEGDA